jgi:hypothetical protein
MFLAEMAKCLASMRRVRSVMPAKAGIHLRRAARPKKFWIPPPDHVRGRLYAGMAT